MDYLIYHKITDVTGKALAGELGIPHGYESPNERIRTLIRWGATRGVRYLPAKTINHREPMIKAIDKHLATLRFAQANLRVPTPSTEVPCVGRSNFHTQGQNFWLIWDTGQIETAKIEGAQYFIKYIPVQQEWRVHVISNEVVFVQRKYTSDRICTGFMGIQGFRDGWHEQALNPEVAGIQVCLLAKSAVQVLGLDFGGVDIITSIEDGLPYLLEVNTGPALPMPETREPYLRYFRREMERT